MLSQLRVYASILILFSANAEAAEKTSQEPTGTTVTQEQSAEASTSKACDRIITPRLGDAQAGNGKVDVLEDDKAKKDIPCGGTKSQSIEVLYTPNPGFTGEDDASADIHFDGAKDNGSTVKLKFKVKVK